MNYNEGDLLHPNKYAILEPQHNLKKIPPENLDLVMVPLIAFDLKGNRLGTGGGYYDRTFAFLREQENKKPRMIGLAYAVQQAEQIPSDPWDVLLDGIVTEQEVILFPVCRNWL